MCVHYTELRDMQSFIPRRPLTHFRAFFSDMAKLEQEYFKDKSLTFSLIFLNIKMNQNLSFGTDSPKVLATNNMKK